MNEIYQFFKALALVLLISSSIIFFIIGVVESDLDGNCEYPSIASYFPTRVMACELFKHRFENQQKKIGEINEKAWEKTR
jgi:hypothetical protein